MMDNSKAVFTHGVRRPGDRITGYCPLPGHPRTKDGALILRFTYSRPERPRSTVPQVEAPVAQVSPGKVSRGIHIEQPGFDL